jgi:hypothetical protein
MSDALHMADVDRDCTALVIAAEDCDAEAFARILAPYYTNDGGLDHERVLQLIAMLLDKIRELVGICEYLGRPEDAQRPVAEVLRGYLATGWPETHARTWRGRRS